MGLLDWKGGRMEVEGSYYVMRERKEVVSWWWWKEKWMDGGHESWIWFNSFWSSSQWKSSFTVDLDSIIGQWPNELNLQNLIIIPLLWSDHSISCPSTPLNGERAYLIGSCQAPNGQYLIQKEFGIVLEVLRHSSAKALIAAGMRGKNSLLPNQAYAGFQRNFRWHKLVNKLCCC